jgi:peptidoglycan/LPS O-acetylase OafA/YrhL
LTAIGAALLIRIGFWLMGNEVAASVLTPARMDALAVGALLALVARGEDGISRLVRAAWLTAGLTGVILSMVFVSRQDPYDFVVGTVGHTLLAVFFGSVLVIALISPPNSRLGRLFASSGLVFFGRYSYAIYIFHHPILFLKPTSLSFEQVPKLLGSQLPAYILWLAVATCFSVILALLSWHLCEKQFLKLKRFFPYESRNTKRTTAKFPQENLLSTSSQ